MLGSKGRIRFLCVAVVVPLIAGACGGKEGSPAASPTGATSSPTVTAVADGEYISNAKEFVDAGTWDSAQHVPIEMGEYFFKPAAVSLEAGKPYVLEVANKGKKKHEFVAKGFFRSSAVRKFENDLSEVKIPVVTEFEVFAGKGAEVFIIPVMPGTYEFFCEITGHREKGQEGTITVGGQPPTTPAPQVAKVADSGWVQNPAAIIDAANWDAAGEVRIEAGEAGDKMFFKPKNVELKVNTPYVITIVNTGAKKHEFVADEFMPTIAFRKAEDGSGEFKGLTLDEVEVFAGKEIELFLIPTKTGTYDMLCEIEGHREKGMEGTITVV